MQLIHLYTFSNALIHINYSVAELPSNEKEADPEVPVASNADNQDGESANQNLNKDEESTMSNDETPAENDSSEEEDALSPETPDEEDLSDAGNNEENSVSKDQGRCRLLYYTE